MHKAVSLSYTLFTLILFILLSSFSLQKTHEIVQTEKKITINGDLNEWDSFNEIPVNLTFTGKQIPPSNDIRVTARFTFDEENFYAAVTVVDDTFQFPSRAWRYGDGFYLTFVDPDKGNESNRTFSYGFSRYGSSITKAPVYRDGEYFPPVSTRDIRLEIKTNDKTNTIIYEVKIPWKNVIPLKPFIHKTWGINLIYVDGDGSERQILQIYPDPRYDTELSDKRKGALFRFISRIPENFEYQTSINASHFTHDEETIITFGINSPSEESGWKIEYRLYNLTSDSKIVNLKKGLNLFTLPVSYNDVPSGTYDVVMAVYDNNNSEKYRENEKIFILNTNDMTDFYARLTEVKQRGIYLNDERFRASIPTLEIRLNWINDFMSRKPPFADTRPLEQWYKEVIELFNFVDSGSPALFQPGRIARIAHLSRIDYTLQPYSIYVPDTYNQDRSYPLFIVLHGSGVDERNTIRYMTQIIKERGDWIILAPQGRGLSDWYTGDSGEDVIECINHIKKLYSIDENDITLDGFSMGGYGAWRLGLLHPDIFKALIIRSGAVSAPNRLNGENILDLFETYEGKDLNVFIVHGDKDNAVSVRNARKAVQKLKELGIEHKYVEIEGAAHGGYNKWDEIFEWLETIREQ